jgi:hypothetical protein
MIRSLIILLCVGWVTSRSEAQGPLATLFEERAHDFGTVPLGSKRVHAFTVTNTTREPLRILSIRIPCNCVTAWATKKELAPGESTTIVAQLDTRRFAGSITKSCFVLFDQPRDEVQLVLRAFSHERLFFEPETLAFGRLKKGASRERSMTISISDLNLGGALKPISQSDFVQANVEVISESPGSASFRLTARLRPDLPVGDWYCTIELRSNNPSLASIQVPLTVTIDP